MKRLFIGLACALAGCSTTGNTSSPDMATSSAICSAPTAVTCTDQSVLKLNLFATVPNRTITNTADGAGFLSEIDATGGATGGAITPRESFVYAKFTDAGLERVAISDEQAFDSMEWDIAFRRYIVRLNSGVSGPSCVAAARTAVGTSFDALTAVPDGLEYRTEAYMTASCDLIPDGSGLEGSPAVALSSYWTYPGCVAMTGNVFIVRRADGRRLKLTVEDYYTPTVQDLCDTNGSIPMTMPSGAAHFRVRWAFL
jgi:hypothetical protein